MKATEQNDSKSRSLEKKEDFKSFNHNSKSEFILPRQGWQDREAWIKAVIKAKRALDIAEISILLDCSHSEQ